MILKTIFRFGLTASILAISFLFANSAQASTYVDSDINTDTTWSVAGSPYIIDTNIYIASSATITIEPGVEVKFMPNFYSPKSIYVNGKILAVGTSASPIVFTSNPDDSISNTDDYSDCYFAEYDAEGNGIGEEICDYYDLSDPSAGDWRGFYFSASTGSIFENVNIKYAKDIANISSSTLTLKNVNFLFAEKGLTVFNNSTVSAENLFFDEVNKDALVLFNDSFLNFTDIKIRNIIDEPILVFNRSVFTGTGLDIEDNYFNFFGTTITLFNSSNLFLKDSSLKNCGGGGCISFFDGNNYLADPSSLYIADSVFESGSGPALITFGSSAISAEVKNSVFSGFEGNAIENYSSAFSVNAVGNWWGDKSGPQEPTLNPTGAGEEIYGKVLFDPWLIKDPRDVCKVDCFSNILFIPGMQGSRLYENIDGEEEELWLTRDDDLQERMYLDGDGNSVNNIYTKDDTQNNGEDDETGLIDEATLGINIYESFIDKLREWKEGGIIADYDFMPYDWRLPLSQIISGGAVSGGNVSYMSGDPDESYLVAHLRALADSSKSGKVTIVAHSYGGIVTKALLDKLNTEGSPLYDKIDKIIFVAVPQIGTPQSAVAVLHGTGVGPLDLVMDQDISRTFAENMETAYNLVPRASYFGSVEGGIISFPDDKLFKREIEKYGTNIENKTELYDYILGAEGREKPKHHDVDSPNIGNATIYDRSAGVYEKQDTWRAPADTKVIEVAGWGAETISGLDYQVLYGFGGLKYKSYKPRYTIDGDGTVVAPSALYMHEDENTERWWVNLAKYNKTSFPDKEHADILEIKNLLSFILSKIKNQSFSDSENIITQDTNTLVKNGKRLHYTLHSPLYLGVVDAEGHFAGKDATGEIHNEITGVEYQQIGEVQFLSIPAELAHTLKLYGYEEGVFALDVDEVAGNDTLGSILFQGIASGPDTVVRLVAPTDSDITTFKLELDYDDDGVFEKVIDPWAPDEKKESTTPPISSGGGGGGSGFPFVPQVLANPIQALPDLVSTPLPAISNDKTKPEPLGQVLGENIEPTPEITPKSLHTDLSTEAGLNSPISAEPEPKSFPITIIIIGGALVILLAVKYILKL